LSSCFRRSETVTSYGKVQKIRAFTFAFCIREEAKHSSPGVLDREPEPPVLKIGPIKPLLEGRYKFGVGPPEALYCSPFQDLAAKKGGLHNEV
jgi:hypothetical protein